MSTTRILFLPGVFLKDCPEPEDSSEEIVELESSDDLDAIATDVSQIEAAFCAKKVIKKYDTIPSQFTTLDKWPKQTNLLCWYCDFPFTGMPWPVVSGCSKTLVSEDSDVTDISDASLLTSSSAFTEILILDTHGNFCQKGCAMAYIDKVTDPVIHNKYECRQLLILFNELVTKERVNYIPLSDAKTDMQKYCGPHGKTDEQYRNENNLKSAKFANAVEKSSLSAVTVKKPLPVLN